jgi:hypothetical protein
LRSRVHGVLKSMANSLRQVSSPLAQLRNEVHSELAKCEDAANAVPSAREEARQAVSCDYGVLDQDGAVNASNSRDGPSIIATNGVGAVATTEQFLDRNRYLDIFVLPYLNLLELRCLVYDSPADIEGQALLWLHSAKESKLKPFIEETTTKAMVLMLDVLKFNYAFGDDGGSEEAKSDTSDPNKALKRNAAGVIDFNALVASKGPVRVPSVSIAELEKLLTIARVGAKFTAFTPILQLHHKIMYSIATLGHLLGNVNLLQNAAKFVLQAVWDPTDVFVRELLDMQVHVQYLVADNILIRIKALPFKKPVPVEGFMDMQAVEGELKPEAGAEVKDVDPRCLGFDSAEVSCFFFLYLVRLQCATLRMPDR